MISIIVTNRGKGDITRREDFTPEKLSFWNNLKYIFVPFWSWYIPPEIYENWEVVIFHMTDLPYGRGGTPLQNLIVRGFKETKISAIKCVKEMDAGPIYMRTTLSLKGTARKIYRRADKLIRNFMIPEILACQYDPIPQVGDPVYFDRWHCSKIDVLRAIIGW